MTHPETPADPRSAVSGDPGTPQRDSYPRVAGHCPACGGSSLFLAGGGHVRCFEVGCTSPFAADNLLFGVVAR